MKILKYILVFSSPLLLQSCFVAREYERPEIKTEELYRTEVVNNDTSSIADLSWSQLFKDPLLQEYIRKGLESNYDIRIAMQNINAAESNLKQRKAGFFPMISANGNWTHQETSENSQFGGFFNRIDQFQLGANVSWEADVWGKIRSTKRAADAQYLQSVAANQAVKTQVISSIASLYFQLMMMDAQIEIAKQNLINREQSVETITALKNAGQVNEVAVKQIEAQKFGTELIIEDLKYNIKVVENSLSILMGEAPHAIERNAITEQEFDAEIKEGVSISLLSKRPDVIAAEYNLVNTFELVNVARSNFYPALTISGSVGFQSLELRNLLSLNSIFANVVTGLTQPIFNQRQVRTQHEIALSNKEVAFLQFEQSLLVAGKEVSDALASYHNETRKLEIREQEVKALKEASEYSEELLNYGMANYLEVLTAKDSALNSELSLINNKFQQFNAVILLYKALGGGWE